jgi:hypothetical protein
MATPPPSPNKKIPPNNFYWFPPKDTDYSSGIAPKLRLETNEPHPEGVNTKTSRRYSKTSTGSKSTNPPTDDEDEEPTSDQEDFEWGFHCSLDSKSGKIAAVPQILLNNPVRSIKRPSQPPQHQLPTSTRMPHLSLNASSPPRRYSADDVDYLRRAMFILETEQHVDVSMSRTAVSGKKGTASGTTNFSTPTTTALQEGNETRQVGAHEVRPRRVEKGTDAASDASGTTNFSTPTTTALQDNETRQVGAHDFRPRRVEKTSSPTSSPSPKFFHSDSVDTCTSTSTESSTIAPRFSSTNDRAQESLLASDDPFMFQFEM